mmetsp:Transcript_103690/g.163737  ORF Transcript_103690/g.163737 Transcript_103690/m.163737 type:complete len:264 (-) Transcript_103690:399-1190(-)
MPLSSLNSSSLTSVPFKSSWLVRAVTTASRPIAKPRPGAAPSFRSSCTLFFSASSASFFFALSTSCTSLRSNRFAGRTFMQIISFASASLTFQRSTSSMNSTSFTSLPFKSSRLVSPTIDALLPSARPKPGKAPSLTSSCISVSSLAFFACFVARSASFCFCSNASNWAYSFVFFQIFHLLSNSAFSLAYCISYFAFSSACKAFHISASFCGTDVSEPLLFISAVAFFLCSSSELKRKYPLVGRFGIKCANFFLSAPSGSTHS